MSFARGYMRDHIVSHKNDHGRSYPPYRALLREECLKIDFREIFEVVRISTFSTVSAAKQTSRPVVVETLIYLKSSRDRPGAVREYC
jgi:hypothetical protein